MYDCHYISSSFSSRITICDTLVNQEYKDISWSISMQKAGNGLNAVFLTRVCDKPKSLLPLYDTQMLHYRGQNQHHLQSSIRLWSWINNKQ